MKEIIIKNKRQGINIYRQLNNMENNEIYINGVDVAGCEHHLSTGYCQLQMLFQGMVLQLPFGKHLECNLCDKDCYYKQLKRLEQENAELKAKKAKYYQQTLDDEIQINELLQTLQEIKAIAEGIKNATYQFGQESDQKFFNETLGKILQKITKAEEE